MIRYGNLWDAFIAWPNWLLAAEKSRRRKRRRPVVLRFEFRREYKLLRLRSEVIDGSYRPGPFVTHWIARPKPRLISAAPYRDRVLHHAVMNILEPILDRHFYPHSYACRSGKGTHAASRYLQTLLRRCQFSLQMDVVKFFPSIDHGILKQRFRQRIKDQRLLRLLDLIVDGSNKQEPVLAYYPGDDLFAPVERRRGLPIGNLTSQWFANWYLDPLDHWLTSKLRVGGFLRYCDDFIVLDNDPGKLRALMDEVPIYLAAFRLRVHRYRLAVIPSCAGRTFVGFRTLPTHRDISAAGKRRFFRRLRWMKRAFTRGQIDAPTVHQRLMSWVGHAGQADSRHLLAQIARDLIFVDGRFHRFRSASGSDFLQAPTC